MPTDKPMQLGMVGLGRMGAGIVRRLTRDGHPCVGYDVNADAVQALEGDGIAGATTLEEFAAKLEKPRTAWVMVPAGEITSKTIRAVAEVFEAGDVIIDGGNTHYHDDIRHAAELREKGIHHVDVGTSGGVYGLERGFCLMIGGEDDVVERLYPLFGSIAPGIGTAERTPGRSGDPSPSESGFLHCGPNGAGHFVKMVHNGIEYGIMAAYAEGLNILHSANVGKEVLEGDAETAPMEHPEYYQYDIDTREVTEVWRRGSVVSSWLLDLTAQALFESPTLEDFSGRVSDSGEGRWTSIAAIDEGVPAPVLTTALYSRFASRGLDNYANRVLSAMRYGVRRTRRDGAGLTLPPRWAARDERHRRLRPREAARRRAAAVIVERGMIVGVRTGSGVRPAALGGAGPRRTLPADIPRHGARDTASRRAALISLPEYRGRSRFRRPGQHDSRTMKRSSRQCALVGLIAVGGSSPTSAVRL